MLDSCSTPYCTHCSTFTRPLLDRCSTLARPLLIALPLLDLCSTLALPLLDFCSTLARPGPCSTLARPLHDHWFTPCSTHSSSHFSTPAVSLLAPCSTLALPLLYPWPCSTHDARSLLYPSSTFARLLLCPILYPLFYPCSALALTLLYTCSTLALPLLGPCSTLARPLVYFLLYSFLFTLLYPIILLKCSFFNLMVMKSIFSSTMHFLPFLHLCSTLVSCSTTYCTHCSTFTRPLLDPCSTLARPLLDPCTTIGLLVALLIPLHVALPLLYPCLTLAQPLL